MTPNILSYGYLEDFKGNPTLLFLGDPSLGLVAVLEQVQIAPLGTRIEIGERPQLCSRRGTKVSFTVVASPSVDVNRQEGKNGYTIDLGMPLEMASEFLRLAQIVVSSPVPCHHYFDISANQSLTILISKDEYDGNSFQWKEHATDSP